MTTTNEPLLGRYYNSLEGEFAIQMTDRGKSAREAIIRCLEDGTYGLETVGCLCGCSNARDILVCTVDRYRIPHRTVLCSSCGLVRTNPRLTEKSYIHFYTHYYRALYERPGQTADSLFTLQAGRAKLRADFVRKHIRVEKGGRIIEIGCGGGWNLLPFRDMGCVAEGFDFDEDYLEAGRQKGLELYRGGVLEALRRGKKCDLIILSHVLEHMLDPVLELNRLRQILSKNGHLYIEVPNLYEATSSLPRYWQGAHTYSFVPGTLTSLLGKCSFRRVAIDHAIRSLWANAEGTVGAPAATSDDVVKDTRTFLIRAEKRGTLVRKYRGLHRLWIALNTRLGRG
jgi:SAM-dependent methyltransferase